MSNRTSTSKRYSLYAWDETGPKGGWEDYQDSFFTLKAAEFEAKGWRHWQVVDRESGEIVGRK